MKPIKDALRRFVRINLMKVMEMGVLYENTQSLLYKAKVCKMSDKSPKAGASPPRFPCCGETSGNGALK